MKTHVLKFRATDTAEFQTIIDGSKTVETRANTVSFKNYQVGDVLVIKCGSESVEKPIKKIEHFDTVQALIQKVGLKNVMPLFHGTPEEAEKLWYSFPGYKEKIAQHGLVAFYLTR